MKSIFIAAAVILTAPSLLLNTASACDCVPIATRFDDAVRLSNERSQSLGLPLLTVLSARVKEYKQLRPGPLPTEMVLEVMSVIDGNITKKEILVEGDNGFQCRLPVTKFAIGKKFLFGLKKENGKYYIPSCGPYWEKI